MTDRIFTAFLSAQHAEGMALAAESDTIELFADATQSPPQQYVVRFRCHGLVRSAAGEIIDHNEFGLGVCFRDDYLRRTEPAQVLTMLGPLNVWHPNILGPFICVGHLAPGTGLVDLLYQVFEILTYNKVTMREDDALNKEACAWARRHQERFPLDRRPLKRRLLDLHLEAIREEL